MTQLPRNKNKTLLIFNGDHACRCRQQVFPADDTRCLVWRENYLEGPLPAVPREEFERIRADFLHSCVPEYSTEKIYLSLMRLHEGLAEFDAPDCEIILYFDCCMYDMIMLARIFSLLKDSRAKIRLFCEDAILGCSPEIFRRDIHSLREISRETAALYACAWECILQGPEALARFNTCHAAQDEPFLADAMLRYGEDHPADGSMGRSKRQLLEIVDSGITAFPEIFQAFDKYEKYMFMGDTHCLRLLEQLAGEGAVRKESSAGEVPSFRKV